jgi:pantoate--beta-alanine ligase
MVERRPAGAVKPEIVPCPTVREADGLALSSRNRYLSAEERRRAPAIYRGLSAARESWLGGERNGNVLRRQAQQPILEAGLQLDYVDIRDEDDYAPVADPVTHGRIVVAARLGTTRLLDNVALGAEAPAARRP